MSRYLTYKDCESASVKYYWVVEVSIASDLVS